MASQHLSSQTWLLTGSSGLVGTVLRAHISPLARSLHLLDVSPPSIPPRANETTHEASILGTIALDNILATTPIHGIIHLAGLADEAPFSRLCDLNILGTYNVLDAARRAGVRRVILASSNRVTGMYEAFPEEKTSASTMVPRADGLYGVSKIAGEALGRLYAEKFGLEVLAVRIGSLEPDPRAMGERGLSTWVSEGDMGRAVEAGMSWKGPVGDKEGKGWYRVFYAVSRNERGWWDWRDGQEVGFWPEDDAEKWAEEMGVAKESRLKGPQGGVYASADYTLERM